MIALQLNPPRETWASLCQRPEQDASALTGTVSAIMDKVRAEGDAALITYTERFDGVRLDQVRVSAADLQAATQAISEELKAAIQLAANNLKAFHQAQHREAISVETAPGVRCWIKDLPLEKVGLYIPGGTAPLFSSLLMLGIPAKIAGCSEIAVCTPVGKEGKVHPAILYTAALIGLDQVYAVGGAQAIAAMTHGTESIPRVDKIFGPGNQYVTRAKQLAQLEGTAIDMPAGPSEVLVIADAQANPEFVAADLLSQAEHGTDSQVILVSDNEATTQGILAAVERQLEALPRKEIAREALAHSLALVLEDLPAAMDFSNAYAPEHLIIATENAAALAETVTHAGSVFIGPYSCESAGDYASGTNHTLPTNGYARNYSGVNLHSFMKQITYQELTATGILNIGPAIEAMAEAEALQAHKNAVTLRLKALSGAAGPSAATKTDA